MSGGKEMTLSSEKGFTLVELLVSVLLTFIVMGAIYSVYRVQTRSMKVQDDRLEAQGYARSVLDLMVREIRNAGYDPTGAGCAVIVAADSQTLHFRYDANGDGDCIDLDEDITYDFSTVGCPAGLGNITRKDGASSAQDLTDCNVPDSTSNFSFAYYAKDSTTPYGTPVSAGNLPNIQRVQISVTVRSQNSTTEFAGGTLDATMTSNVSLRNRGLPV